MGKKNDDVDSNVEKLKDKLKISKEKKKKVEKNEKPKSTKTKKKTAKAEIKKAKKTEKTENKKIKTTQKIEKKKAKEAEKEEEKTLEDQLEEQLSKEEIENFQIEKVNMEKLTTRVCGILAEHEDKGIIQSELWKKLKLTSRDGSRLALKLERLGIITREKILEKERWTYKLILKKTPISTQSLENAPCLTCPVEQKCTLEGEISPRTCTWIQDWVFLEIKKPLKAQ